MKIIFTTQFLFLCIFSFSQTYYQYFDGNDTLVDESIFVEIDSSSSNIWQVGVPQKTIFKEAASVPNAILTDTINVYPNNNHSSFTFSQEIDYLFGIIALQWNQKLDMESGVDGGTIEYKYDDDTTWHSSFNNPYVYNFFGYDEENVDTLSNGQVAFSGVDSLWKNVWLCIDNTWVSADTITFRFTFLSDSIQSNQEGWMLDNFIFSITQVHTVNEVETEDYLQVYPNPSDGIVHIKAQKIEGYHAIEAMHLYDESGRLVQQYGKSPTKFYIDIGHHPNGVYYLWVKTNIKEETHKIILQQ